MLHRRSRITHPNGDVLETPLLVPSFSSKGFRFRKRGKNFESEITVYQKSTAEVLDTVLFSAYDIKMGFINKPPGKGGVSFYPRFTFIDSGGYETSDGYDFSEVFRHPISIKKNSWNIKKYNEVIKGWKSDRFPAIIVSYDNGHDKPKDIRKQIEEAQKFFKQYPKFLNDFLIKPSERNAILKIKEIISNVSLMDGFHIIGLTEKELGISLGQRAANIVMIRRALDSVNNNAPLHIFGSLDPLTSVIYFLAGAEIFDGLTWLRYGYNDGAAVYQQNYAAIKHGIDETDNVLRDLSAVGNLVYLRKLQSEMKQFVATNDFNVFAHNSNIFRQASQYLQTLNK